jgi:glycosyltransferase involved in cell wall biosynthesis
MRILLVHNQFNDRSGPETYIKNISRIFKNNNIEYSYFSFKADNIKFVEHYDHLPESIVELDSINKSYGSYDNKTKFKLLKNSFYNNKVNKSLKDVLQLYKPDLVYLLQFHLKLSSSVIDACKDLNIPVICRLSDFNFVCANNILLREGKVCTKCIDNTVNQIKYNCLNSYSYTILDFLVRNFNNKRGIYKYISHFIIPSEHNKDILNTITPFKNKITAIQSPYLLTEQLNKSKYSKNPIFLNFGRQTYDKGVDIIIDNFIKLKDNSILLKLIGEQDNYLKNNEHLKNKNIRILGKMPFSELKEHIVGSNFCIHASRWFDNLPNSLIEATSLGIPSIIPNFGSFKDLINNGMPCIYYEEGKLTEAIEKAINLDESSYLKLSNDTKKWSELNFSSDNHFNKLIKIFNKTINND